MKIHLIKLCTSLILISLVGCNDLENMVIGDWAVHKSFVNEKEMVWKYYSNGVVFNADKTCNLPISHYTQRNSNIEHGQWKVTKKKGNSYLIIQTENELFNNQFEIVEIRQEMDSVSYGQLLHMTLSNDSLRLELLRVL